MYWLSAFTSRQLAGGGVALGDDHVENRRGSQLVLAARARPASAPAACAPRRRSRRPRAPAQARCSALITFSLMLLWSWLVLDLRLAVIQLVGDQVGLGGAVADGHGEAEAGAVVGEVAGEDLAQHGAVSRPGNTG